MDDALRDDALQARAAIQQGRLRGTALGDALCAVPVRERDGWVDVLLALPELPADSPLPPGAVPYLPCAVDTIARAVREAPVSAGDVFVDLGAGLGRVVMLAHLLSGARAIGVELQPQLARQARAAAAQLDLRQAHFITGDASAIDIEADREVGAGTVFFIYASFGRAMLQRVLARLKRLAARRRIVLCAVDFEVHEPWLRARPARSAELVLYDSIL
jgi:precorrin-6B methylase 2